MPQVAGTDDYAEQLKRLMPVPAQTTPPLMPPQQVGAPGAAPAVSSLPQTGLPATPGAIPAVDPSIQAHADRLAPQGAEGETPMGSVASKPPPMPLSPHQVKLEHDLNTPSGGRQIHNPWLSIPLQVLNAVGTGFAPRLTSAIPGSSLYRQNQIGQDRANIAGDEKAAQSAAQIAREEAQTEEIGTHPQLREAQTEVNRLKGEETARHNKATEGVQGKKVDVTEQNNLRKQGLQRNADTNEIEPVPEEQMSAAERDLHQLKGAQAELASAGAAYKQAQAAGEPEKVKAAQQRLVQASRAHDIAAANYVLNSKKYEAEYHGTEGGQPLPGVAATPGGTPVGPKFQSNVNPTGMERNRGELAESALSSISDMKEIVQRRKDLFGPAAGRGTNIQVWLGSNDPDAQKYRAARATAASHFSGMTGTRSEQSAKKFDDVMGQFKTNPAAALAGLEEMEKTAKKFKEGGTVHTAPPQGGNNALPGGITLEEVNAEIERRKKKP